MRRRPVRALGVIGVLGALVALATPPASADSLPGAPGCPTFPADSWWHSDISSLPVHPQSAQFIASMGAASHVHPDFGTVWDGAPIGIPYVVVGGGQPAVPVSFDYADESDAGPYRVPADAPIEGGASSDGDRHVLIVDRDACQLEELFDARPDGHGGWTAGSGAIWDLRSNALRPDAWTSADAAGLPILPGLVRRDEVAAGSIDHAIRVTANRTQPSHLWPARHDTSGGASTAPPMGLRLRLKGGVDISGFPRDDQVILQAMKTYGLVVADNGSSWYVSGVPDPTWDDDVLHSLGQIAGSDFEAVDASSLMVDPDSGQASGSPAAGGGGGGGGARGEAAPDAPNDLAAAIAAGAGAPVTEPLPAAAADTTTTAAPATTTAPVAPPTSGVAAGASVQSASRNGASRAWWVAAMALGIAVAALAAWFRSRSTPESGTPPT